MCNRDLEESGCWKQLKTVEMILKNTFLNPNLPVSQGSSWGTGRQSTSQTT